jgi:PAS domain S-box-containing protein
MKNVQNLSGVSGALRRRAEEQLEDGVARLDQPGSDLEARRLLHELQVHQIELEMQNAELGQARDALEKALEQYTDLYDFAPVGYLSLDGNGVIGAVNLAGAGLLGVERSRLLGLRFGQFVAATDRTVFSELLVRVLSGQGKEMCEVALAVKASDQPLFVQIAALPDPSGRQCRVALIDITRRRRSEDSLREIKERESKSLESKLSLSEARFALFMENLPGAAFIKDPQGRYIFCNKGCRTAFAKSGILNILDRTDAELWPPEIASSYMEHDRTVLASKTPLQIVQPYFQDSAGRKEWMLVSKFPILGKNGEAELLGGIGIDISGEKEAEDALLENQAQLSALTAELSLTEERERRRIAGELHDQIGQTLAFVKIKLDVLLHDLSNAPGSEGGAEDSEACGPARVVGEIRQAIETSIREVRTLTFKISPPLLYELGIEAAIDWLCEWALENHGLKVQFLDDGQPKILGEGMRSTLFQAVRELLINIAKHAQTRNAAVSLKKSGTNLVLRVTDEGVGFEVGKLSAKKEQRNGFGLLNIRQRIGYLGGEFYLESEVGRGSQVTIMVPLPG